MEDKYGILTDRELEIFYEALTIGQRITATHINRQLVSLNNVTSDLLKKKKMSELSHYIQKVIALTKEEAKEQYKEIVK